MNKKIVLIGGVLLGGGLLAGCNQATQNSMDNQVAVPQVEEVVINQQQGQVQEQKNFDKYFYIFNEPYKKVLLATGKKEMDKSQLTIKDTVAKWQELEKTFLQNQPEEYSKTKDWDNKLKSIKVLLIEADKLITQNDLAEAHEKLEKVRAKLRDMRVENEHVLLTDKMLEFHDAMEEVVEDGKFKNQQHISQMVELLEPLLTVSNTKDVVKYNQMVSELESVVKQIQTIGDSQYQNVVNKLKPTFIKLYMQFG